MDVLQFLCQIGANIIAKKVEQNQQIIKARKLKPVA